MTLLLIITHFGTNFFLSTKVIREREKREDKQVIYRPEVVTNFFALKYFPAGKKRYIHEKIERK